MAERFRNNAYRFLRWSERYFKTDMVYLSRGGFWLTLGQVVSIFSLFLLSIVFANSISPETYGVYRYILSVAGMFAVFTLPGMMPAIVRATAQGKDHLIHAATRERATWSLLGVVVALLGAIYYFVNENNVLATALFIVAFFLPFFDTFSLYNAYLVGKKNFKKQTLLHLISQLVSVVFLTTTLFITDNIILILLAYFVPLALVRFILYVYTTKKIVAIPTPKNEENLIYGKHLSAMNVFSAVSTNIDKFLLWHFLGPAQVAIYVFAVAIPEQIKGPLKGLGELALPKFAEKKPDEIRTLMSSLWYKILWYGFFLLITSLVYIVSAPFIFSLFFTFLFIIRTV